MKLLATRGRPMSQDPAKRRDLRLYWWGQTTNVLGSSFTAVALPVVAVVVLGATPAQIGVISAAAALPVLLFGLPAGALADRISRPRRTLIALDSLSAVLIAVVALGLAQHEVNVSWLIALNAVDGCMSILGQVVYFIHLRQLVAADEIGPVRARLQVGSYSAGLAGQLLVGPTIVLFGSAAALGVDAVSYLLSAAALMVMSPVARAPRGEPGAPESSLAQTLRGVGEGARFFARDPFHRALMAFIVLPVAAESGVGALTGPFLLRVVHVPTSAYGAVFALAGLTGLAGSAVAGRVLRPGRDPRKITLATFTAASISALLLPLAVGPVPVAATLAALGLCVPVFFGSIANVALSPVIVADVPQDTLGRVSATLRVFVSTAGLVGALGGGALGSRIGVRDAIWVLDGAALATALLVLPSALRAARRLHEASRPEPAELVDAVT